MATYLNKHIWAPSSFGASTASWLEKWKTVAAHANKKILNNFADTVFPFRFLAVQIQIQIEIQIQAGKHEEKIETEKR